MIKAFAKFETTRQGILLGDVTAINYKNYWTVVSYDTSSAAPYDVTTGRVTGQVVHQPITLGIPFYKNSLSFDLAHWSNETFKKITIVFVTTSASGELVQAYEVVLTNALLVSIRESGVDPIFNELTFLFQRLELVTPSQEVAFDVNSKA